MPGYDFASIEKKWQAWWEEHGTFVQPNPGQAGFADRPKYYVLDMFPYPSGAGLHVGHPEGYTATDIVARYRRMRGFNVLHPMGYDAFGLPAEQYAVEHGVHPRETTERNIANIERQIKALGFSYDWSRRLATTDVGYYRWTQWIFLQLFNSWWDPEANAARPIGELVHRLESGRLVVHPSGQIAGNLSDGASSYLGEPIGMIKWHELTARERAEVLDAHRLAYLDEVPVNWCPMLGTVLANEEVTNEGRSERGDHPVYRRALKQWMLRITAYAERLLDDLALVDWPEPIKAMQRNWIGKSMGAEVTFPLAATGTEEWFQERKQSGFSPEEDGAIVVYTTRPDTLYGATYMVLAPEHPLVGEITTPQQSAEVQAYVEQSARKSELERTAEAKEKTGVFTGAYAVNPVTREPIPIWVADYVLMGYGTGAIMAVPAHDERDFDFAKKYSLEVKTVVVPQNSIALGVPIETDYSFDGVIEEEPNAAEWAAVAKSIVDEFRKGNYYQVAAPESHIRVMKPNGKLFCSLAGNELRQIHDSTDPEAFKLFSKLVRQRAAESQESYIEDGVAVNSAHYDGLPTQEFKKRITADLEKAGLGRGAVHYKLRDWLFSRQRYWGEPFPIVHCERCGVVALREDQLPLELPEMADFTPASSSDPDALPQPPLGKAAQWVSTTCPNCGAPAKRELNTMPQWAGSCWYFLRYLDPHNDKRFCDPKIERYWMKGGEEEEKNEGGTPSARAGKSPAPHGIDLYVGGAEHAVLHLLYSRFWHKVLFDLGHVSTSEPFGRLFNQGMIRSFAYRDKRGVYVGYDEIDFTGEKPRHKQTGEELAESVEKMSKSLRNVVNPDEAVAEYGADTFRLYEMFMGPLDASKPWNTRDVPGVYRFLNRVWRMIVGDEDSKSLVSGSGSDVIEKALHKLIKKAGEDIEAMKFNTPIAAMMEFVNAVYKAGAISPGQAQRFLLVLAPFAPHIAEELWQSMGHSESLAQEPWPAYDPALIAEETVELAVQVNGKVRAKITVPVGASKEECVAAAKADAKIAELLAGKTVVKEIVAPGRLVNLVVK
jgi:leucyl-tRNA synthetase